MKKHDLIRILNELYLKDTEIEVKYGQQSLFKINFKENKIHKINKELIKSPEMPDDLKLCFQLSNILKWENQEEIKNSLLNLFKSRDLKKGNKRIALCYDTNALSHRCNRIIYKFLKEINPNIVMPTGVLKELEKFNELKLKNTFQLDKYISFANMLRGQLTLYGRKIMLGFIEANSILRSPYTDKIESDTKDENILTAIQEYQKQHNMDIVILTEDSNFVSLARGRSILAEHIKQTTQLPFSLEFTWEELADLIYILAIMFGQIKLERKTITGLWPGKTSDDWFNKEIEIS